MFTSTLAFSFLIVGIPHVLPCPVPPRPLAEGETWEVYTDKEGRRRRRRISKIDNDGTQADNKSDMGMDALEEARRRARECPVPKPTGLVGQIMGFKPNEGGNMAKREIRVEPIQQRRKVIDGQGDDG